MNSGANLTNQKGVKQVIKIIEDKYRYLFEESPAAALIIRMDGTISEANRALLDTTGYSIEELVGRSALELVIPEQREIVTTLLQKMYQGEWTPAIEINFYARNGSIHTILFSAGHAYIYENDTPSAILLTGFDITQRKRTEEKLRSAVRMEALVGLAGSIAHDFNNLLTVILNYSKLIMRDHKQDSATHEMLSEVLEAAQRAEGLTKKLMLFGRKQMLYQETFNVNARLEGIEGQLLTIVGDGVKLEIGYGKNLWNIHADPGLIEDIVISLVTNSREALSEGGTVAVSTTNTTVDEGSKLQDDLNPGKYVLMTVLDDGTGIDDKIIDLIYDPFFTTKHACGLGLSIVYGAVRQCGGKIFVDSRAGEGAAFRIFFPAVGQTR